MMDVKVGDQLFAFDVNGSRIGQPEGGWPVVVTQVGRKFFTVQYGSGRTQKFALVDGVVPDAYRHRSVLTGEQVARHRRHAAAIAALKAHHIELGIRCKLTLEHIEALAEVAKTFTVSEED